MHRDLWYIDVGHKRHRNVTYRKDAKHSQCEDAHAHGDRTMYEVGQHKYLFLFLYMEFKYSLFLFPDSYRSIVGQVQVTAGDYNVALVQGRFLAGTARNGMTGDVGCHYVNISPAGVPVVVQEDDVVTVAFHYGRAATWLVPGCVAIL